MDNKLSYDDFLLGKKEGVYIVENPIIGYKKIKCDIEKTLFFENQNINCFAIAQLEIPIGSTIIRPKFCYNNHYYIPTYISSKLRTDIAIVKNIDIINPSEQNSLLSMLFKTKITYYSLFDDDYKYEIYKVCNQNIH